MLLLYDMDWELIEDKPIPKPQPVQRIPAATEQPKPVEESASVTEVVDEAQTGPESDINDNEDTTNENETNENLQPPDESDEKDVPDNLEAEIRDTDETNSDSEAEDNQNRPLNTPNNRQ